MRFWCLSTKKTPNNAVTSQRSIWLVVLVNYQNNKYNWTLWHHNKVLHFLTDKRLNINISWGIGALFSSVNLLFILIPAAIHMIYTWLVFVLWRQIFILYYFRLHSPFIPHFPRGYVLKSFKLIVRYLTFFYVFFFLWLYLTLDFKQKKLFYKIYASSAVK